MPPIEYLDPEIANEGESANNWSPGAWTNAPAISDEEYQPDIEPPHINDYAAFKKHKVYAKYFRPSRYQPFPAFMYHPTLGDKIVKSKEEVIALGPEWSPKPIRPRIDMTGKTLPVKNDTQRLTEALVAGLANKPGFDASSIATIVAATVAALQQSTAAPASATPEGADDAMERSTLLDLAAEKGIKVDGRWSNKRIKEALGLE